MLDKKSTFLLYYLTLVVSILSIESNSKSNYVSFPAKENGTCYKRVPYDDAIAADISKGIVQTVPGSQQAGVKTSVGRAWVTIIDCCEGYTRSNLTDKCETHCDDGCLGGTCTGPNICTCEEGWHAEGGVCKAICRQRCAENAYCFAPDVCTCKFGYDEEDGVCKPVCLHGCRNGDCLAPHVCRCRPGYYLNETQKCEPVCEGGCPHGQCTSPGICSCSSGYVNPRNDPETCVPECPDTCINGECFSPGVCTCKEGYTQAANGSCTAQCQEECINGFCTAPDQCACNPGLRMIPQLRKCVEVPNNGVAGLPEVSYGDRGHFRPQESSQVQNPSGPSKSRESNQTHGAFPVGSTYGTQGIIKNRNGGTSEQQDMNGSGDQYGGYRPNQSQSSDVVGVKGINRSQVIYGTNGPYGHPQDNQTRNLQRPSLNHTPNPQTNDYGLYGTNQDNNRQRSYSSQGPNPSQRTGQTRNPTKTSTPYNVYESEGIYSSPKPYQSSSSQTGSDDPYNVYSTNKPQNPQGVQGPYNHRPGKTQNPTENSTPYSVYENEDPYSSQRPYQTPKTQTNNPQRPQSSQGPFPTQRPDQMQYPDENSDPDEIYRNNQSYKKPQRPLASQGSTQGPYAIPVSSQTQRPTTYQGPFPTQNPHQVQNPEGNPNFYDVYKNNNQNNQTYNRPQGPFASQGSTERSRAPLSGSPTQNLREITDPYEFHGPSQTHNPIGVGIAQTNGPYGAQESSQTYRPPGSSVSPGYFPAQDPNRPQGSRIATSPSETQGIKINHRRPYQTPRPQNGNNDPYSAYGTNKPQRPEGSQGLYLNQRPGQTPDQFYGNSGVEQTPSYLGVELGYGPSEIYIIPDPNAPLIYPDPTQAHVIYGSYDAHSQPINAGLGNLYNPGLSLTHGIHELTDPYNSHTGNDGIARNNTMNEAQTAGATATIAICAVPCYNGECVDGQTECRCKQGYVPDPRYPFNMKCVPVCYGGCINGVCTAPNLCICNPGFVKERGVKGSKRCVPAY